MVTVTHPASPPPFAPRPGTPAIVRNAALVTQARRDFLSRPPRWAERSWPESALLREGPGRYHGRFGTPRRFGRCWTDRVGAKRGGTTDPIWTGRDDAMAHKKG